MECNHSVPIAQPELFDMMYFGKDEFNQFRQFHISGNFINILNNIDNYYKEQNMNYFE